MKKDIFFVKCLFIYCFSILIWECAVCPLVEHSHKYLAFVQETQTGKIQIELYENITKLGPASKKVITSWSNVNAYHDITPGIVQVAERYNPISRSTAYTIYN